MRQLLALFLTLILSSLAFANDFAAVLGARTNSADLATASTGVSGSGKTGFQAGVLGFIDLASQIQFRSGFIYTQRVLTVSTGGTDYDLKLANFDIPLTAMFKFSEYGGVFGGAVLSMNASKDASAGLKTDGVKSSMVGYQFGASFKFAPQLGAELYYELLPGNIQDSSTTLGVPGFKDAKSVAVNLMFTFE